MQTHITALFENSGFIQDNKPVWKRIRKAKLTKIADLCEQSCDISSYSALQPRPSIFSHTASAALGGDRHPCSSLECRLERVRQLVQFAALYSDKVYIRNLFQDYTDISQLKKPRDLILGRFTEDLLILSALLPLINAGRIQLVTFQGICPHCLSLEALEQNAKSDYDKAITDLTKRYLKEISYSVLYKEGSLALVGHGHQDLIPHGELLLEFTDPADLLSKAPSLLRKAKTTGEIKLTTAQANKIQAAQYFADPIITSVAFELGGTHFLKTSYLSDNDLELSFIRSLSKDPIVRRHTTLMSKYLTCIVPFIDSVNTTALIRLRDREQEAFSLFRAALTKAIEEYKSQGEAFTERDAQAVYADIIHPRLATLDAKIRSAKRTFRKGGLRKVLGWTGAISIGLYTGIFTADPLAGTAAFGVAKVGAELLESTMGTSDVEETIKQDDMYFLWKVRQLSDARAVITQHYPHLQS